MNPRSGGSTPAHGLSVRTRNALFLERLAALQALVNTAQTFHARFHPKA
ncbi:MAG: hypothetical protein ABUL60_14805 [Myxococcales bacterium]